MRYLPAEHKLVPTRLLVYLSKPMRVEKGKQINLV